MKVALVTISNFNTASSRLRAFLPGLELRKKGYRVDFFTPKNGMLGLPPAGLRNYDVAILQKFLDPAIFDEFTCPKILDIDENYFDKTAFAHDKSIQGRIDESLKRADLITADSDIFKKYLPNVMIIPDCLDVMTDAKKTDYKKTGVIGWTGYSSNIAYLRPIMPIIKSLGYKLRIITNDTHKPTDTWPDGDDKRTPIEQFPEAEVMEWDIETVDGLLAECDFGIAPLFENDWCSTKGMNKILKYWGVGLPVVCGNIPSYQKASKETGIDCVAHNPDDWKRMLSISEEERKQQAEIGCKYAQNYKPDKIVLLWEKSIQKAISDTGAIS